jgi:diguanylate cyclase (GGDEF)-like protein
VVVDLDRFRAINESLGRQAGDALLVQAGARLAACAADPAHVARTGGDQFALIHPGLKSESELARATLDSLRLCFGEPFRLEGGDYRVAARAGIALFPDDGADAEVLLRNAEAAVLKAKAGKDAYLFYTERLTARVAHNLTLENRLRHALERQEFVLHYQPKVEIASRRIVGAEALIRWNSEEGLVPPSEFIPMLEETGMIVEVGAWVLRQAVHDRMRWRSEGVRAPRVAVNVSVIQLRRADFLRVVRDALAPGGPAHGIDFEITESLLALDAEGALAKLTEVRTLGVDLAIDDFGTGYSSLAYLARLPVQQLKIDRAFIVAMLTDPRAMTLVSTIALMARSMGFTAIAEGVETEEQARALLEAGCVQMQGYLTGRPMPAEQLTPRLERESVLRAPEAHPFR